eukprot:jgi/Chlat1/9212/Chrsp98S09288
MDGKLRIVCSEEEFDEVLHQNKERLVVLDCSMTWCGPCKMVYPKYKLFAENYKDAVFLYANGDSTASTAALFSKLGVREVPAFYVFRDGKLVHKHTGTNQATLRTAIISQLKPGEAR